MSKNYEMEDKALRLSIVILIVFAFAGIIFGTILSSDVVFFDGVFSLFSVIISFITLRISRFIHKQDHFNFPFGKENIEPVVVIIQYMILIGFLLYALYDAVIIILSGGSEVELGGVIIYLLFTILTLILISITKIHISERLYIADIISNTFIAWVISFTNYRNLKSSFVNRKLIEEKKT